MLPKLGRETRWVGRTHTFDSRCGQLEKLEHQRAEVSVRIIEQQTHIRMSAEQELRRSWAGRLDTDMSALRERLSIAQG